MITALVILLIFGGGFGGKGLNLSDPQVLAEFRANVNGIIPDPNRAANVTTAVYQLNEMSWASRNPDGLIENEIQDFRRVASNYNATPTELQTALRGLEIEISRENHNMVQGREAIRRNTTKDEWKQLLKSLSK